MILIRPFLRVNRYRIQVSYRVFYFSCREHRRSIDPLGPPLLSDFSRGSLFLDHNALAPSGRNGRLVLLVFFFIDLHFFIRKRSRPASGGGN